jgi:hypothetical protein
MSNAEGLLAVRFLAEGHEVRPPGSSDWLPYEGVKAILSDEEGIHVILVAGGREFTTTTTTPWPCRIKADSEQEGGDDGSD